MPGLTGRGPRGENVLLLHERPPISSQPCAAHCDICLIWCIWNCKLLGVVQDNSKGPFWQETLKISNFILNSSYWVYVVAWAGSPLGDVGIIPLYIVGKGRAESPWLCICLCCSRRLLASRTGFSNWVLRLMWLKIQGIIRMNRKSFRDALSAVKIKIKAQLWNKNLIRR